MTKYVTTEEQFQCHRCRIHCAKRELREGKYCPNCGKNFLFVTMEEVGDGARVQLFKDPEETRLWTNFWRYRI